MSGARTTPATPLPEHGDPFVRVWVRQLPWDVFYAAGRPTWVASTDGMGRRYHFYDVASWPELPGDAGEALRKAEALLEAFRKVGAGEALIEQFRLPAGAPAPATSPAFARDAALAGIAQLDLTEEEWWALHNLALVVRMAGLAEILRDVSEASRGPGGDE